VISLVYAPADKTVTLSEANAMCALVIDPEEMKRVAIHESGHAIMAVELGIVCHGVFLAYEPNEVGPSGEIDGIRFCVPVGNNPPWKNSDYLQSAAGAGAEKLFFKEYNPGASAIDREMFSTLGAPGWESTVDKAKVILAKNSETVSKMAEAIIFKHQNVPMRTWPDRGMGNRPTRFKEILSNEEVLQMAGIGSITKPTTQKDPPSEENTKTSKTNHPKKH
jgi:hypothetical protein